MFSMFFIAEFHICLHITHCNNDPKPEDNLIAITDLIDINSDIVNLSNQQSYQIRTQTANDDFSGFL